VTEWLDCSPLAPKVPGSRQLVRRIFHKFSVNPAENE